MIVAGLDLATRTGVAIGPAGGAPVVWSEDLKPAREAPFHASRLCAAQGLVHRLITDHGVRHIAIEKPFNAAHNDWATTLLAFGLAANVLSWAARKEIEVAVYPPQTVARHFIGSGQLKRAEKKAATRARCRALGWTIANEDEADAAALWDLHCARLGLLARQTARGEP